MTNVTILNAKSHCPICEKRLRVYRRQNMKLCTQCGRAFSTYGGGHQISSVAWVEVAPGVFEDQRNGLDGIAKHK
jgi:ribosomal protein L37AE/L43A